MHPGLVQRPVDVVGRALGQADKGGIGQGTDGNGLRRSQGVVEGQDGQKLVVAQGHGLKARRRGQRHKAQIHAALAKPLLHVVVVAAEKLQGDLGMCRLEGLDDPRQPVHGHAGEGAQAHGARVGAANLRRQLGKRLIFPQDFLNLRQHQMAALGEGYAAAAAAQEGKAEFRLQLRQDVADARLGGAQRFRRPGEAAQFHGLGEDLVFL